MALRFETIKGKKLFSDVFQKGQRFFENNSMAVVFFAGPQDKFASDNFVRSIFYSVSVPKKNAKKAVVRNRIKRLMRESLRQFCLSNDEDAICLISHISFVWRNAPDHPALICLDDVKHEIYSLMRKALAYKAKITGKETQDGEGDKL